MKFVSTSVLGDLGLVRNWWIEFVPSFSLYMNKIFSLVDCVGNGLSLWRMSLNLKSVWLAIIEEKIRKA